jgi:hypothetical protein
MTKIKLTPHGGYVVGDGPCPFDPDKFILAFGDKVLEAQRQGLAEILLDDAEVDFVINQQKAQWHREVAEAPVMEIKSKTLTIKKLLEQMG